MKVWIVIEKDSKTNTSENVGVYFKEDLAFEHTCELDECAGGSTLDWHIEEWDVK